MILHGSHLLLHYSRTQAGVALSSAEAELNAALKMGCEILGISQFCRELGNDMEVKINDDSSAVKDILAHRGCGKVENSEVKQLWLQEQVRSGKVGFLKVPGGETALAPRAGAFWKSWLLERPSQKQSQ